MIAAWAKDYVGLPYANQGREMEGADCWGLVRLVVKREFGRRLPSFDEEYADAEDCPMVAHLVDVQKPLLTVERVEIEDAKPGDVVLLRIRNLLCHVGVYVGDGCMLHVRRGTAAVVESLRSAMWIRRLEGIYRV